MDLLFRCRLERRIFKPGRAFSGTNILEPFNVFQVCPIKARFFIESKEIQNFYKSAHYLWHKPCLTIEKQQSCFLQIPLTILFIYQFN
jgi:hypothetical protein